MQEIWATGLLEWNGWGWSIPWCTDPWAINYNPLATVDNWSCLYDENW